MKDSSFLSLPISSQIKLLPILTSFTDQRNIVMGSGVRLSLDNLCNHQITFCKLNLHISPPSAYFRRLWHYIRVNNTQIRQAISHFNWEFELAKQNPSWQVAFFNKALHKKEQKQIIKNYKPISTTCVC